METSRGFSDSKSRSIQLDLSVHIDSALPQREQAFPFHYVIKVTFPPPRCLCHNLVLFYNMSEENLLNTLFSPKLLRVHNYVIH